MLINEECKRCQYRKNIDQYPADAAQEAVRNYRHALHEIVTNADALTAPELSEKLHALRWEMFGDVEDYTEIKLHYDQLMLDLLPFMEETVHASSDPLKAAIQYAMVGNYIDFGALETVTESGLKEQLDKASAISVDPVLLEDFRRDLAHADRLVYFTDNCGEIVTDKLLISVLRQIHPDLHVCVIVRGKQIVNDATMEDAAYIHMEEAAHKVIGNGNGMPGTVIGTVSQEAADAIRNADLLISKGQGNYEGLSGCGLPVYYFFLCKCEMFMKRFHAAQFTGIMTKEQCLDVLSQV